MDASSKRRRRASVPTCKVQGAGRRERGEASWERRGQRRPVQGQAWPVPGRAHVAALSLARSILPGRRREPVLGLLFSRPSLFRPSPRPACAPSTAFMQPRLDGLPSPAAMALAASSLTTTGETAFARPSTLGAQPAAWPIRTGAQRLRASTPACFGRRGLMPSSGASPRTMFSCLQLSPSRLDVVNAFPGGCACRTRRANPIAPLSTLGTWAWTTTTTSPSLAPPKTRARRTGLPPATVVSLGSTPAYPILSYPMLFQAAQIPRNNPVLSARVDLFWTWAFSSAGNSLIRQC